MLLGRVVAVLGVVGVLVCAPPAGADPVPMPPNCQEAPVFGVNPFIRTICDGPMEADGSWMRHRLSHYLPSTRSTCQGGILVQGGCPVWLPHDYVPERYVEEQYRVTPDTIPPGEPGYLE